MNLKNKLFSCWTSFKYWINWIFTLKDVYSGFTFNHVFKDTYTKFKLNEICKVCPYNYTYYVRIIEVLSNPRKDFTAYKTQMLEPPFKCDIQIELRLYKLNGLQRILLRQKYYNKFNKFRLYLHLHQKKILLIYFSVIFISTMLYLLL